MIPESIHWLRPLWLLLVPILLVLWWWVSQRIHRVSSWEAWVDDALQPHVLTPSTQGSSLGLHALFMGWLVCVVALAGPVWEQQPVPVFEARPSLVAVVDVSPSMTLEDLPPSRMERLVFKLSDFLEIAKGVDIGLLVFAERPYVVSPLTSDVKTLQAFLPSISTDLAPVSGSQLHLAIDKAVALLKQAGKRSGQIVVFTDSRISEEDLKSANAAKNDGYLVSVVGVGTPAGAPLRNASGDFVRDGNGAVVVPKVNITELQRLAAEGGGVSSMITRGAQDLTAIFNLSDSMLINDPDAAEQKELSNYWVEHGVWVLPLLFVLSLGLFRRGLFR